MKILSLDKWYLEIELDNGQTLEVIDFTKHEKEIWINSKKTIKLLPIENYPMRNAIRFTFEDKKGVEK